MLNRSNGSTSRPSDTTRKPSNGSTRS
jgi:hypothetical protein